jgi:hypothetical protein
MPFLSGIADLGFTFAACYAILDGGTLIDLGVIKACIVYGVGHQ